MTKLDHRLRGLVGRVHVGKRAVIADTAIIGKSYRSVEGESLASRPITSIGPGCEIGDYVTIERGSRLGNNVTVDDHCLVEQDVDIGSGSRLIYHAILCNAARVGTDCVIGGFIGERSRIGNDCRVFGSLVHSQDDPSRGWDEGEEKAPTLGHHVLVGFGAVIIGDVKIGPQAVVSAGAIVTKSVPKGHIASGVNCFVHHSKSRMKVARSRWFRGS